jgi:hypothetical protein
MMSRCRTVLRTIVVVVFYLIYPVITKALLRVFNCSIPINGKEYLVEDYSEMCWTNEVCGMRALYYIAQTVHVQVTSTWLSLLCQPWFWYCFQADDIVLKSVPKY